MKNCFHHGRREIVHLHIRERIRRQNTQFSITQQRIADYVIGNYRKAAFLNSSKLAKVLNVSQATLYRFAVLLGWRLRCGYHRSVVSTSTDGSSPYAPIDS